MFANVVFLKKLPHWDDEEGSPIGTARVILPTFLTRKKINLRSCKQREVEYHAYCLTSPKSQNFLCQVLNLCKLDRLWVSNNYGCLIQVGNNIWQLEKENTNKWWTWIIHLYKSETTKSSIRWMIQSHNSL